MQNAGNAGGNFVNLEGHIDMSKISCLNQDPEHTLKSALTQNNEHLYLKSADDHQLIIYIPFSSQVKVHHIILKAPNDDSAPKLVKVYKNMTEFGFEEAEDHEPAQELLLKDDSFGKVMDLKYVKFQNVTSIAFFVEENFGGEFTRINKLELYGVPLHQTNMSDLKKVEHDQ